MHTIYIKIRVALLLFCANDGRLRTRRPSVKDHDGWDEGGRGVPSGDGNISLRGHSSRQNEVSYIH